MTTGMLYIDGAWSEGSGDPFHSTDPATGETLWTGRAANAGNVADAMKSAQKALPLWSAQTLETRLSFLQRFQTVLETRRNALAETLARETGKALWDAKSEIAAMIAKLPFTLAAYHERTGEKIGDGQGFTTALRHKPIGIVAVYGPYNFPAHLPNGHLLPALLAGNCCLFKPSEQTPLVAEAVLACWHEAGIPRGVLQLLQGERETGKLLSAQPDLNGIYFTGSSATGKALHTQFAGQTEKLLALELGGNNPLVVHAVADARAAAYWTIMSAYHSSGQRCTCARRLIVPAGSTNDHFIETLCGMTADLRVGAWNETPEPFMGPLISNNEADAILAAQAMMVERGGKKLLAARRLFPDKPFVTPAIIDVTGMTAREDREYFGPLLQLIRVPDLEAALTEANRTRYGLSSGIFTDDRAHYDYFLAHIRAGVVNWNRPLTGSSAGLPFGGVGQSGNFRPAAYYAADYCAYPVASNEADALAVPANPSPGIFT